MFHKSDRLGIVASILCIVHCLTFPLLPFTFYFIDGHESHHYFDYIFIFFAILAIYFSYKRAHSKWIKKGFIACAMLLILSILLQDNYYLHKTLIYTGGITLIYLHIINILKCNRKH